MYLHTLVFSAFLLFMYDGSCFNAYYYFELFILSKKEEKNLWKNAFLKKKNYWMIKANTNQTKYIKKRLIFMHLKWWIRTQSPNLRGFFFFFWNRKAIFHSFALGFRSNDSLGTSRCFPTAQRWLENKFWNIFLSYFLTSIFDDLSKFSVPKALWYFLVRFRIPNIWSGRSFLANVILFTIRTFVPNPKLLLDNCSLLLQIFTQKLSFIIFWIQNK